jgi:arylsulfatase A-like enzyme
MTDQGLAMKTFPRIVRVVVGIAVLASVGATIAAEPSPRKPNILLVLADDLGFGDVGCYNPDSKIPTPNLDRLAATGVRFTDAHAAASVCSPSRYGLLTGQYPWRTRPQGGALGPWAQPIIAKDRLTLPGLLKHHGYTTACIGKWHLGWNWPTKDGNLPRTGADNLSNVDFSRPIGEGPTTRGFDYYFGTCVPNYPPYCFIENDHTVGEPILPSTEFEFPGPKIAGWKQEEILPELTRRAVRYIEQSAARRQPFFLYFALTSPHHPILPTPEFQGKSRAGDYGDFLVQTDWTIGQVLDALDRTGLSENTLVIFSSDNGPEVTRTNVAKTKVVVAVGAYDRIQKYGHASMGSWRGIKTDAWEGGHRVPFVARWPGHIPAGTTSGQLLCLTDILAACAALVGANLPPMAGEDSYNALPAMLGQQGTRDSAVLQNGNRILLVRKGDWVWINGRGPTNMYAEPDWYRQARGYVSDDYPGQLYEISGDASQRRNLYVERPEKLQELQALLNQLREQGRSRP